MIGNGHVRFGRGALEKGRKAPRQRPTSAQETSGRAQAREARRWGTRAIWLKLDCLYPNLQKVQVDTRRKCARSRRRALHRHKPVADATSGARAIPSEGIRGDEWGA
jgi:hypothetical protein